MAGAAITKAHMTLYLKYRPQIVEELDETAVREAIQKALAAKNLPHAWLFSGPRGTGKTSSARILAKAINCLKSKTNPCNECEMCVEIMGGNAPDIVEIDAASNRGIEEIRELREKVRLAPMRAKFKVYIIDEVHMLTTEAANALLKTLEEPPESTIFILCTTDPEKLPETVISRCTRIIFKKPTLEEAVRSLERVAKGEGIKAEREGLEIIAREAKGSFRDGTKILEQVLLGNQEITAAVAKEATGQLANADPEDFLKLWEDNDQEKALKFISQLANEGINLRTWVERLVELLRQRMLADAKSRPGTILRIRKLERAYEQMKTTAVPQLPLEIMVLENDEASPAGKMAEPAQAKPAEKKETPANLPKPEEAKPKTETKAEPEIKEAPKQPIVLKEGGEYTLDGFNKKWQDILKAVKPKNHSIEGLLRSTKAVGFDGEKLVLEVFYKFHKDKLESDKCRTIVEEAVGEVFGTKPVKLFLQLGQKVPKKESNLSGNVGEDIVAAAAEIFKADVV